MTHTDAGGPDVDWEVPSHEVASYKERAHKYALVIPVINEGERIRGQLSRIKNAELAVDVVVADGGSTDGSLDADFVEPVGVRAVLTKTGPGKLSAQLRMAYAWCLRQGYEGIITIDGNGKDGVEAVADFIEKLDDGCDYVQGSRYLPGGEAENTPLERTIANRLIHAPLLSIAGRNWFLDTTNGFRAYSARYLTHPDVQPFRSEFEVYNLLFYLTVRAGQLGLKVGHVPVVRRYPESGKVPTKIGGLSSKLALLGETVQSATGGYTPDNAAKRLSASTWPAAAAALVLVSLFLSVITAPKYSPDSWAFYELSKTVFGDFYRFSHFRSYASASEYSSAFAPLWPSLIAIFDGLFGTGARTGVILSFASFFGFTLVSENIGRKLTDAPWIGTAVALILLLTPSMVWDELIGGRTIPLQLLLYALVLRGLLEARGLNVLGAAGVGLLAGIAVMNRFDAVFLPVFTALAIAFVTRSAAHITAALAASVLAVSPWVAYSMHTFGSLFATDNSSIAIALDSNAFVTDWWPETQPALADNPSAWLAKVFGNLIPLVGNGLSLLFTPMGASLGMAAVAVGVFQTLCAKAPLNSARSPQDSSQLALVLGFVVFLLVSMVPQIVTGYLEYRYYSALIWTVFLAFAIWQVTRARTIRQRRLFAAIFAAVIGLWVIGLALMQLANAEQASAEQWASFGKPADVSELKKCLGDNDDARILVLGDDRFAAQAGALGSLRTMMEPRNMAEGRLDDASKAAFIEIWNVDYILIRSSDRSAEEWPGFNSVYGCELELFAKAG